MGAYMNKLSRIGMSIVIVLLVLLFFVSLVFTNEVSATPPRMSPSYNLELINLPQADYLFIPYINSSDNISVADHKLYLRYFSELDDESFIALTNDEDLIDDASKCFLYTMYLFIMFDIELGIDYVDFAIKYLPDHSYDDSVGFSPASIGYFPNTTEIRWECTVNYYSSTNCYRVEPYLYDITHDTFYSFSGFDYKYENSSTLYTMDYSVDRRNFSNGKEEEPIEFGNCSPDSGESEEYENGFSFDANRTTYIVLNIILVLSLFIVELAVTYIFGFDKRSLKIVASADAVGCAILTAILYALVKIYESSSLLEILLLVTIVSIFVLKPVIYQFTCNSRKLGRKGIYGVGLLANILSFGFCTIVIYFLGYLQLI